MHSSPGLASLFAVPVVDHVDRILDLGPAVGPNLAFYARFARTVRFADLLRDAPVNGSSSPADAPAFLDECLVADGEPYDLVLAWDVLNYLGQDQWRLVIERLLPCTRGGTRLFAIVSASHTMPARPLHFEIEDPQRVRYRGTEAGSMPSLELAPAEVGRLIAPFRVERSVVLRHGVREYVAIRPREAESGDAEPPP